MGGRILYARCARASGNTDIGLLNDIDFEGEISESAENVRVLDISMRMFMYYVYYYL